MGILRQVEGGMGLADVCREHAISSATFYKWRSKYGGMDVSMISDMKAMEDDGWCGTPYPHHIPGVGGPLGGDPENPVYKTALGNKFSANVNAKAAITLLGKILNNGNISKAAEMI